MASFDFISGEDFRSSLEADYTELISAISNKQWKAAHVLAGSIIEAILVDHLIASEYQKKTSHDPLSMTLNEAISACRKEKILSERTEHLSHVIRSYRNLIHPGRSIRLGEIANEKGAKIAQLLLEMIIEEISALKKKNYGYTAEQILTKIENDPSAKAIILHLLKETNEYEKERLMLNLIPKQYSELIPIEEQGTEEIQSSLEKCFRLSLDSVSEITSKKVLKEFARIIKEESSDTVWRYIFFRGSDLQYLSEEDALLVKQHLLSLTTAWTIHIFFHAIEGIGSFLVEDDVLLFITPFVHAIANGKGYYINGTSYEKNAIKQLFLEEYKNMCSKVKERIKSVLEHNYKLNINSGKNRNNAFKILLYEIDPFFELEDNSEDEEGTTNSEEYGPF